MPTKTHILSCIMGLFLLCFLNIQAFAQPVDKATTYINELDDNLTIRKLSVLPILDNVDGILSRPFENELINIIQNHHQWNYIDAKTVGPMASPADLEADPTKVMMLAKSAGADGVLSGRVSKGPDGVSIQLSLFLAYDGKVFSTETVNKLQNFDVKALQAQARELLKVVMGRVPYQGLVLSRTNNRVTLNIGKRDNVEKDQIVTAIQIIKAIRHPKFHVLINTEKEILGKIKIRKVEDTLSFGDIISEKERGVIKKFAKITGVDIVNYGDASSVTEALGPSSNESMEKPGNQMAFGKEPKEWVPVQQPSFGLVNISLGLGNFTANSSIEGSSNINVTAQKPFYFNLRLRGELWLNSHWSVETQIRQGTMSVENPRSGSSPTELNLATNKYSLHGGYNLLIRDDFYGPKVQILFGLAQYSLVADNSAPVAFTSMTYRGLDLGLRGSFPLDDQWRLGGQLFLMVSPALSEAPVTSGGSVTSSASSYALFGTRKMGQRLEATGSLEFEYYQSSYEGTGSRIGEVAKTTSQRITTFWGGINYMF
ncbi:MAG: hypothetical protein AB7F59_13880 [Bdellovibrionales bacterium]